MNEQSRNSTDYFRALEVMANRLRRHSITSTTAAGSGHPSTCLSSAELIAVIFFHALRFDVKNPDNPLNDRFVLSKGHGIPAVWGAWAEAGAFSVELLETLRRIDSDLEGHPTPRNPWADVATGSLGQGLSIGLGMAISNRMDGLSNRVFVLTGDGELAEGSVWEAAMLASYRGLDNLVAVLDINRYGQSQQTMYGGQVEVYRKRFEAFGWDTQVIDGHDVGEIVRALDRADGDSGKPQAIIADTLKGKGVSFMENRDGWHGKPVPPAQLAEALAEIGEDLELPLALNVRMPEGEAPQFPAPGEPDPPSYESGARVATRQAYGTALAKLGASHARVVALDGDTKNSTYSLRFLEAHPERFVECFIAESNMVGAAVGLSALGKIPFASTFACFLTRAYDQIRMGAISQGNFKLCGSHCGISIGPDGPSQMGLEDIAMMRAIPGSTVFYPSDAVSSERLVKLAAETPGIVYIRTSRPKTPILYGANETFEVGGSKVLRSSDSDRVTLVGAGITLHEALAAHEELAGRGIASRVIDLYSVKPVDKATLRRAARETGSIITIEDHYPEGGLGDAVLDAIANLDCQYRKMAVRGLPRSGDSEALLAEFEIDSAAIVEAVLEAVDTTITA